MPEPLVPAPALPTELPVLPLRRTVVFPFTLAPLGVNRPMSAEAVNRALAGDRMVVMLLQQGDAETPAAPDLRTIGTVGVIRQMSKVSAGFHLIVEGISRVRAESIESDGRVLTARITPHPEKVERSIEIDAYVRRLQELIDRALSLSSGLSQELRGVVMSIDDPLRLCYLLASLLDMPAEDKQRVLESDELQVKLSAVAAALGREVDLLDLKGKIESQAQEEITQAQRQYFLREQLKAIQKELGEGEPPEMAELRARIDAANLPEHVATVIQREVSRLERMPAASPEYQMIRTYIDSVLDVPWSTVTEDRLDPLAARQVLDEDHYDLDKVKERIVEHLAVRSLKADMKGPLLCFVGPPGVGKTSLGQSIARAMNRKFVRVSLGGIRDEADIRGHRRTYIGSMPGRIIQGMRQAGSANPVFMLDELDKVAPGFQGDPAAALLEVLDPAQNHQFRDHYLEIPYDLSRVLFIATANQLGPVHPALLDRLEVLNLSGYTEEEKIHIAEQYLIPRQLAEHGLTPEMLKIHPAAVRRVIAEYTREAGVRNLERFLGTIARKIAARIATERAARLARAREQAGSTETEITSPEVVSFEIGAADVPTHLGPPRVHREVPFRTSRPGVATGVAWTETGGDVLFVEAQLIPNGHQTVILTGHLGNVMQESARAAVSHIRAVADKLGIDPAFLDGCDLHIHVPAGAIPKDGPSAGVTIATAIVSAARNQTVREDVAMTGEITLSGLVLPVGGIREKALAARRYGIKTFIFPKQNEADLQELPPEVRRDLTFVPVETLEEVLDVALPRDEADRTAAAAPAGDSVAAMSAQAAHHGSGLPPSPLGSE